MPSPPAPELPICPHGQPLPGVVASLLCGTHSDLLLPHAAVRLSYAEMIKYLLCFETLT